MTRLTTRLRSILRLEGYIGTMNLIEQQEYTPVEVLVEAIRIHHVDLVDMLMDEYSELRTPRVADKIFYLTNLTHYPKLTKTVLSHLPSPLRSRYGVLRLVDKKNETT